MGSFTQCPSKDVYCLIAMKYKGVQGVVHKVHNDLAGKTLRPKCQGTSLHLVAGALSLS